MNVLPIGGKSPSSTVVGMAVSGDGDVSTSKKWSNEVVAVYDNTSTPVPSSAGAAIACTAVDLTEAGAVSLRVSNSTNVDIEIGLYRDDISNSYQMRDASGDLIRRTIRAGVSGVMFTPDDLPALQWIRRLRVYFVCDGTPSSGKVTINAVIKK